MKENKEFRTGAHTHSPPTLEGDKEVRSSKS